MSSYGRFLYSVYLSFHSGLIVFSLKLFSNLLPSYLTTQYGSAAVKENYRVNQIILNLTVAEQLKPNYSGLIEALFCHKYLSLNSCTSASGRKGSS